MAATVPMAATAQTDVDRDGVEKADLDQFATQGLLSSREPLSFLCRCRMGRLLYFSAMSAMMLATAAPLAAQTVTEQRPAETDSSYICVLKSEDVDAFSYMPRNPDSARLQKTSASILVSFVNQLSSDPWPQQAKDAVNYAASIWAGIVSSQIAIRLEATWTDLGSCSGGQFSLASAGPQYIYRNFRNAPKPNTWYPDALADALRAVDNNPGKADIVAKFNRSCGPSGSAKWYLGLDGKPPSGTIDMVSVALHEFAHGLGIFGSADVDDGQSSNGNECNGTDGVGCIGTGSPNEPLPYDRFTEDGNGVPLLSLSNPSATLGTALVGGRAGGIYFSGPKLTAAGFDRARLYAPSTFNLGASYAHVDENTYNRTPEALMTPFLAPAESIHVPGMLACGILADAGWTISGECSQIATATQPPETVPETYTIAGPYPNPLVDEATIVVSVPVDQQVKIDVFDTLGRLVLNVFNDVLTADRRHLIRINASEFSPGAYIIAFRGEFGSTSRSIIVAK